MMMKDREKKIFINKSQIKRLKDSGVSLVYLFGSYAEGKSLPLISEASVKQFLTLLHTEIILLLVRGSLFPLHPPNF